MDRRRYEALGSISRIRSSACYLHDITTGNNGFAAEPGYDLVTGRGTPIANEVVRGLTRTMSPSAAAFANGEQVAEVADVANPNLQDLFTIGSGGHVTEDQFNDSTHTSTGQSVIDWGTSFPQGSRITAYNDGESINLFAVDSSGQLVWDQVKSGVTSAFYTFDTQYSFSPGQTVVAQAQSGQLNIFAVGTDGYVKQYQYVSNTAKWQSFDFSPNMANFRYSA